jgi:hypothetical protein
MATYQANPIQVQAVEIVGIGTADNDGNLPLALSDGTDFTATPVMLSRIEPVVGDYVVTQADGYVYLNPKAVFETKYSPV